MMPLITFLEERGVEHVVIDQMRRDTLPRVGEIVAFPFGNHEAEEVTFNLYMVMQIVHYPLYDSVKVYMQWKSRQAKVRR